MVSRYALNGVGGGFDSLPSYFVEHIQPTNCGLGLSGGMQSPDALYKHLGGASECGSIQKNVWKNKSLDNLGTCTL